MRTGNAASARFADLRCLYQEVRVTFWTFLFLWAAHFAGSVSAVARRLMSKAGPGFCFWFWPHLCWSHGGLSSQNLQSITSRRRHGGSGRPRIWLRRIPKEPSGSFCCSCFLRWHPSRSSGKQLCVCGIRGLFEVRAFAPVNWLDFKNSTALENLSWSDPKWTVRITNSSPAGVLNAAF